MNFPRMKEIRENAGLKQKDIAFLLKIIELTKDNKNKALLKTLLIDYI